MAAFECASSDGLSPPTGGLRTGPGGSNRKLGECGVISQLIAPTDEVRYFVLADRGVPYLLARVRWPDVAQALSAARPDWLDDPGLFDLPYDPSAVNLSFSQAASVAAGWGRRLHAEPAEGVPSYIRRMPANWSDLSASERRTWGIEFVGRRPARALPKRPLRWLAAKIARSSGAEQTGEQARALTIPAADAGPEVDGPLPGDPIRNNGGRQPGQATNGVAKLTIERRRHERVALGGRAYIRCEEATISAGLVDLSQGGVGCVLPQALPVASDATLAGPFLLEAEVDASRLCLTVTGQISWHQSAEGDTHFGVALGELGDRESEGLQRFLATARKRQVHR
jgi:PilZ domain